MLITIIGSGNVATHLAAALKNAGHRIAQIFSPSLQHAALLAYHIGAEAIDNIVEITADADLFIIAVNDDAIEEVAQHLAKYNKLIVHTSGATSLQTLLHFTNMAGVFYPLQTFSKDKEVDFRSVPLCIEGANEAITAQLIELGRTISNNVQMVNTAQRKTLHLAAVFACNFPNYLYHVASQLLAGSQLDFGLLRPLIMETANKIEHHLPANVQTGPAIRNDTKTMDAHLQLLHDNVFLQKLYQLLSEGIINMDKNRTSA